jgi:hypothetical protein
VYALYILQVQPEDGSKEPKNKMFNKKLLGCIILYYLTNRETHNGDS